MKNIHTDIQPIVHKYIYDIVISNVRNIVSKSIINGQHRPMLTLNKLSKKWIKVWPTNKKMYLYDITSYGIHRLSIINGTIYLGIYEKIQHKLKLIQIASHYKSPYQDFAKYCGHLMGE